MAFRLPRGAKLLRFPSGDGLQLEGRLTPGDRERGVVLCHPHPLYGGSMLTPVILTVEATPLTLSAQSGAAQRRIWCTPV